MTRHELQCFYLERLGHLVELHEKLDASPTPAQGRLVDHALCPTYRDCELVGLRPVARAMLAVTSTIPIVSAGGGDFTGGGLAARFARPGGNVTGLSTREVRHARGRGGRPRARPMFAVPPR
jgi:hypothetical protein